MIEWTLERQVDRHGSATYHEARETTDHTRVSSCPGREWRCFSAANLCEESQTKQREKTSKSFRRLN